jgi:hypothetical protein
VVPLGRFLGPDSILKGVFLIDPFRLGLMGRIGEKGLKIRRRFRFPRNFLVISSARIYFLGPTFFDSEKQRNF